MDSSFSNLHLAIVSSPGMGHLIPVVALANRLATIHHVRVTVIPVRTAASPSEAKLLKIPLSQLVQILELPIVDISPLIQPTTKVVTQICIALREAAPLVRSVIAAMDPRPDAFIMDFFCSEMLPIAVEFNLAKYVFFPSTPWFTALTVYCPVLDREIEGQYVDQKEPLRIPGCKPVRPGDVVITMEDRNDQQYEEYLRMGRDIALFDGIIMNSWKELDPKTLQSFVDSDALGSVTNTPVYPIGPLTRPVEIDNSKGELMAWLDRQPNESVVFVSFGSGGMLSPEQTTELAWGLELSGQRFVWVVRPPTTGGGDEAFFKLNNMSNGGPEFLPDGFTTRVEDVGFLVPKWAQQIQILTHPAVGGFLSHCGWNSSMESIVNGVPIIPWPLYGEQRMNTAFLAEEVGVALPRLVRDEVVGREEIARMLRRLMEEKEGQCIREKVKKLKKSAVEALKLGGSSHKSMCEVLAKIASNS